MLRLVPLSAIGPSQALRRARPTNALMFSAIRNFIASHTMASGSVPSEVATWVDVSLFCAVQALLWTLIPTDNERATHIGQDSE